MASSSPRVCVCVRVSLKEMVGTGSWQPLFPQSACHCVQQEETVLIFQDTTLVGTSISHLPQVKHKTETDHFTSLQENKRS